MNNLKDGATKIHWYLITALTAVALSLVGAWAAETNQRVSAAEKRISVLEMTVAERMASIDTKLAYIQENVKREKTK